MLRDILDYLDGLETGPHYTSPESRLHAARRRFDDFVERALRDDSSAFERLVPAHQTLQACVVAYYASSAEGAAIMADATFKLRSVAERRTATGATKSELAIRFIDANREKLEELPSRNKRAKALKDAGICETRLATEILKNEGL